MRVRNVLVAMAGLAALAPAPAWAGGGLFDGARRAMGGRGGDRAPVHIPSFRPSAAPRFRPNVGSLGSGRGAAPSVPGAASRSFRSFSGRGLSGGQGVPGGGQAPAFRGPSMAPSTAPRFGEGRGSPPFRASRPDVSAPGFPPAAGVPRPGRGEDLASKAFG